MAIEKTIEIKVDAKQATKSLDELGGSFEDVYGEIQPLSGRIGELEDRLYEMASAGQQGTQEFKDLTAEVGKMKKVIVDTDMVVDGMSQTMAQNLGGALGGITSAFELGAGAMGAMGVESEKVEEALLRVQSASAIAQGFQGIRESVASFKALGVAIRSSAVAQKVLNVAMKANPIGLIITAITALIAGITALIANFEAITNWLGITDDASEEYTRNELKRSETLQKERKKAFDAQIGQLDHEINKRRALGEETYEIELEKLKTQRQFSFEQLKLIAEEIKMKIRLGELDAEQAQAAKDRVTEMQALLQNSKNSIELLEIEHQKKLEDTRKAAADKRKEREAKEAEERLKKQREEEEISSRILNEFILHAQKSRQAQELELLTLGNEEKLNANQNFWAAVVEGNKKKSEEELQQERELQKQKLELASAAFGAIGDLINSFAGESEAAQERAFNVTKAVNLAQAITNTALAVTAALTAGGNPIKLATGAQFIEAGIAAAAGAAQIATIARTQFNAGGGGAGGGTANIPNPPTGGGANPATFNVVGNTGTNQLAQTLGQQPLQAYVVAGDVTSAQSLERNKIQQSTL